jgi:RND family efflux transporter MFP subunit
MWATTVNAQLQPVGVVAEPVGQRQMSRELRMPATLVADEQVDLFAKASGYVAKIEVDIGSPVTQGQALVTLQIPEMNEELNQARAVLQAKQAKADAAAAKVAQADHAIQTSEARLQRAAAEHALSRLNRDRQEELRAANAVPEQALDEAKSQHAISEAQLQIARAGLSNSQSEKLAMQADEAVARAEVSIAQANVARLDTLMSYATIRAPFDGIVTRRMVDRGAFVRSAANGATMPLLTAAKVDRIRMRLDIPEIDSPDVRRGTAVRVVIRALGGEPMDATIARVAGAIDPQTRTMHCEVDLDNAAGKLLPGMYAKVTVMLESRQALMVPSKAIRVKDRVLSVLIVDGGKARSVPIEVGYDDGIWAEVVSGLSGGETVITAATGAVSNGSAVQVGTSGNS